MWIKALRRVVEANSLFKPVLNCEDESTPLERLQHAATSPTRMLALLDRNQRKPEQDRKMDPFFMTTVPFLEPDLDTRKAELRNFEAKQELLLVPGGRFILMLSISFSRLTVIDVGRYFDAKSKGEENPPFADYTVSAHCQSSVGIFRANISLDGNRLFIVNSETRSDGYCFFLLSCLIPYILPVSLPSSIDKFTLWKYDPLSNELRLEKSVYMETFRLSGIETHYMTSNLFIFMADGIIYIWDFINDKYIRWGTNQDICLQSTPQVCFSPTLYFKVTSRLTHYIIFSLDIH